VPKTIIKDVRDLMQVSGEVEPARRRDGVKLTEAERRAEIARLEKEMKKAAQMLEYEYAALLRDQLIELRGKK
jgi:excinuclease ABC subunit B